MKKIELTKGKYALVDDADYGWLSEFRWYFTEPGYAVRNSSASGQRERTKIYLHREIMKTPEGLVTDHINRNKLDNRRKNLRACTPFENLQNSDRSMFPGSSGFRGVWKSRNSWVAGLCIGHKARYLGSFKTALDAAIAYNVAAVQEFGQGARLNDLPEHLYL